MNRILVSLVFLLCLGGLGASCSLTLVDQKSCTRDAECSSFGLSALCQDDGFCGQSPPSCDDNGRCKRFGLSCNENNLCVPLQTFSRCTRTYPSNLLTRVDLAEFVVFGTLMDQSLDTHVAREQAARLAVLQANGSTSTTSLKFGLVFCDIQQNVVYDDSTRTEAAVATSLWLSRTLRVPAIIGPSASGDAVAVFSALAGEETLIISPSATSPALERVDVPIASDTRPGLLWRTAPSDAIQAAVIAADMDARSADTVTIIYERGPYGQGLADGFVDNFTGASILLTFTSPSKIPDTVLNALALNPDEVLFISSQLDDVEAFLAVAAIRPEFDAIDIFVSDTAATSDFLAADNTRFARVRGTRPAPVSGPVYDAFQVAFAVEYDDDASRYSFVAHSYDAAWLLIHSVAFAQAGTDGVDALGIARGLRRLSDPGGFATEFRSTNWPDAFSAITGGQTLDVSGASGDLDYDPVTEETTAPYQVWFPLDQCDSTYRIEPIEVGASPPPNPCP